MIEIKKYYDEYALKDEYYSFKFGVPYKLSSVLEENFLDEKDVIDKFRELVMPYNECKTDDEAYNDEVFIYVCYFLKRGGYYIKDFPDFIDRPTSRMNFSYNKIREKIISEKEYHGIVEWATRRKYISALTFAKKAEYKATEDIRNVLKQISTRSAEFEEMSTEEKLKEICNCIEFLLKDGDKFRIINYASSCGYIEDKLVKKFRNQLECFRHSTKEALEERNSYSLEQQNFLINYGILILEFIMKNK